jgi:hypothetical protein
VCCASACKHLLTIVFDPSTKKGKLLNIFKKSSNNDINITTKYLCQCYGTSYKINTEMDLKMYIPCSRLHDVYCIGEHSVLNLLCKLGGKRLYYAHACCNCISYVILKGGFRTPTFCLFLRYILNTNHRV